MREITYNLRGVEGEWYCPMWRTSDGNTNRIRRVRKAMIRTRKGF